jgi:hypothetical protein
MRVSGSHSGIVEDSDLLGFDTALVGTRFPTFRRQLLHSSSWSTHGLLGLLDPEDEGTTIFRNVRKYLPNGTMSH